MKHRGNSKIKYEHHIIPEVRELLESIEHWPEIISIIPGQIHQTRRASRPLWLDVKYPTRTGLKVLAKSPSAVQEVFFVTRNVNLLRQHIASINPTR